MNTSTTKLEDECPWCSGIIHYGSPCPRVKAIEYHPNGMIKRVEFKDERC
jgi:hypothetical protein